MTLAKLSGWTRQYLSYKISSFIIEAFIKGLLCVSLHNVVVPDANGIQTLLPRY